MSSKSLAFKWSECFQNHHCSWGSKKKMERSMSFPRLSAAPCYQPDLHPRVRSYQEQRARTQPAGANLWMDQDSLRSLWYDVWHMIIWLALISEFSHQTWWFPLLCTGFPHGWCLWYDVWHMVLIYLIWDWHDFCKPRAFADAKRKLWFDWMWWICARPW